MSEDFKNPENNSPSVHARDRIGKGPWFNAKGELIFTLEGERILQDNLQDKFRKYVVASELNPKLTFHCLRHTFASWLVQKGVSIYEVSKLLGHADIKTTQIYAHLRSDDLRNAVERLE